MTHQIGRRWAHGVPLPATGNVAWIDVIDRRPGEAVSDAMSPGAVLDRIGSAVRADDQVCPVGVSMVAVRFGSVASSLPLDVVGHRLAVCVTSCPGSDRSGAGITVAVGIAASAVGDDPTAVASRARGASRSATRILSPGPFDRPAVSTVSTVVAIDEPVAGQRAAGGPGPRPVPLRRRVLHLCAPERSRGAPLPRSTTEGADPGSSVATRCILVVDPMATSHNSIGFPAEAVVSVGEGLGFRTGTAVVSTGEPPVTSIGSCDVDLVVLVLDGAWVGRSTTWSNGAWGRPARLAATYVDKGIPVLAVSAGAGAGAMAACVTNGAVPVFSLDLVGAAIQSLDGIPMEEARLRSGSEAPAQFRALLGLTAGERRVLFHLTEGWAAQDIAEELVVSLTTVRSHIRSILRKLEVRSQLAAVAIANSRDLAHHRVTGN